MSAFSRAAARSRHSSYRQVFAVPGAGRLFGAAAIGRLSYGTVFLSLMLGLTGATGSYAVAGAAMALFGLAGSVLAPVRGALVDRFGARRVLPPLAAGCAALLIGLAVVGGRPGTPVWLLLGSAAAAGAVAPPLGPVVRARWGALIGEPELRQRAFALDTVAEEVLYVTGPLLAGALAVLASPTAGVLVSAALMLLGSLALAAVLPATGTAPAVGGGNAPTRKGRRQRTAGLGGAPLPPPPPLLP
ncbi:MFS transporter, partial [Kitasatospora sp. LaBMicrA B282]|uniref:MFS transporter n=1 Tax=Kitasatospora sp. LaBMicrA B282 TaxID=3420949 RepID=UPI003D0D65C1